jgi:hypothetical protein
MTDIVGYIASALVPAKYMLTLLSIAIASNIAFVSASDGFFYSGAHERNRTWLTR